MHDAYATHTRWTSLRLWLDDTWYGITRWVKARFTEELRPFDFAYDNTWLATEFRTSSRKLDGTWHTTEWERAHWNQDFDSMVAGFEKIEHAEREDLESGGVIRREVAFYCADAYRITIRERRVYPGVYANVERLKRAINEHGGPLDADDVAWALGMILVHDQGERDDAAPEGHCRHGVYVGGCGVDWMCGACESSEE